MASKTDIGRQVAQRACHKIFEMARKQAAFMRYIRLIQLIVWLAILLDDGLLIDYILQRRLDFENSMTAVEFIVNRYFSLWSTSILSLAERLNRLDWGRHTLFCQSFFFTLGISHYAKDI